MLLAAIFVNLLLVPGKGAFVYTTLKKFLKIGLNLINHCPRLLSAAILLFGFWLFFYFSGASLGSSVASIVDTIPQNKEAALNKQEEESILGGPLSWDNEFFTNQSAIDFTVDDEAENLDYVTLQEGSLLAPTNPSLMNAFLNVRKDIIYYTVKSGDTPEGIALSFNLNTNTVLWANNLKDGDIVRPGDSLMILPINGVRHKVKFGDTVSGLAKLYQADAEEIRQFNFLSEGEPLAVDTYVIAPDGETPKPARSKKKQITLPKFVPSLLLSKVDWLIMPATGFNWGRLHSNNGVDITNRCGTPIYASASGLVILSDAVGWNGGYGKYIRIQHPNGAVTLYAHNQELLVQPGQAVSQGQLIAIMGSTGRSTGCHVHFEVRGAKNPFARR